MAAFIGEAIILPEICDKITHDMKKLQWILPLVVLLWGACQSNDGKKPETAAAAVPFDNTKDPICNMAVKASYTDTAHLNGKVYGFCSEHCRDEFKADPAQYMDGLK